MKDRAVILVFLFALIIFVSFFLPWVSINSPVTGAVSKILGGKSDSSFMKISGYQVPILANRSDSRFMVELIQLFNPGIKDADKKSWLIWVVPILAVIIALANVYFKQNKWFDLAIGIIGVAIFAVGTFKLLTTDLDKLVMSVRIMPGLWIVLLGYLCIGLACLGEFVKLNWLKGS